MINKARVEYRSNNSGGGWWLKDEDWKNLEAAGWEIDWIKDQEDSLISKGDRWLGALAKTATRRGLSLRDAAEEWEKVVNQSPLEAGCSCCGQPHDFTEYDESGEMIGSGPEPTGKCEW